MHLCHLILVEVQQPLEHVLIVKKSSKATPPPPPTTKAALCTDVGHDALRGSNKTWNRAR
jgi:hypothetical protein